MGPVHWGGPIVQGVPVPGEAVSIGGANGGKCPWGRPWGAECLGSPVV